MQPDYVYDNRTPTGSRIYTDPPMVRPLVQMNPLVQTRDAARDAANAAFQRDFDLTMSDPEEAQRMIERVLARLDHYLV